MTVVDMSTPINNHPRTYGSASKQISLSVFTKYTHVENLEDFLEGRHPKEKKANNEMDTFFARIDRVTRDSFRAILELDKPRD